jgi:hypothetical protein
MGRFVKGDDIMKITYEPDFKGEKIPSAELTQMGIKLKQFVENYRKYILINMPNKDGNNSVEILNKLDIISHKMITHQYQDLFDDVSIVDRSDDSCPF